jgi:hypothetical protein
MTPTIVAHLAAAYRMELRLICWHWSYGLLQLLWTALLLYGYGAADLGTARFALEGELGNTTTMLVSLLALFVAGASATRGQRTRFAPFDATLPTGSEVLLGRWLAVVTALLGFTVQPLLLALRQGPLESALLALPRYLGQALLIIAVVSLVAWGLMSLLGRWGRWVYLLLVGGWLGLNVGLSLRANLDFNTPQLELLRFASPDVMDYAELWGRLRSDGLPTWFNAFYLGLLLLLLASLVAVVQRHRLRHRPLLAGLVALLACGLATSSAVSYASAMDSLNARIASAPQASVEPTVDPNNPADLASQPERIVSYELDADLRDLAQPQFNATLELENGGNAALNSFRLTLHHDLAISEASLPFTRDGDFLTMQLPTPLAPGQRLSLNLRYGGSLWMGFTGFQGKPMPVFFSDRRGLRLSTAAGWYPLAGHVPLTLALNDNTFVRPYHLPAAMRLTATTAEGMPVAMNLPQVGPNRFAAEGVSWALLLASPELAVSETGDMRLIAARHDMAALRPFAEQYTRVFAAHQRFLPDVPLRQLTVIALDENFGLPSETPPTAGQPVVVASRSTLFWSLRDERSLANITSTPVTNDVWQLAGALPDTAAANAASLFLFTVAQANGDLAQVGILPEHDTAVAWPLVAQLGDLLRQQGDAAVIRALGRLRTATQDEANDVETLSRLIAEAANGS